MEGWVTPFIPIDSAIARLISAPMGYPLARRYCRIQHKMTPETNAQWADLAVWALDAIYWRHPPRRQDTLVHLITRGIKGVTHPSIYVTPFWH